MTTSVQDRPGATVVLPSGRHAVGGSILLIEDSAVDALRTLALLRARMPDMACQHVASLAEATPELVAAATCVLLDLSLPDATGQEGLTELRRRATDVLVIVLTGLDDPLRAGLESIRNGAQDYITKDALNATVLERTIRFVIARKRFRDDSAVALHHAAIGRSRMRPAASWQRRDVSRRSVGRSLRRSADGATSYRQTPPGRDRSLHVANEVAGVAFRPEVTADLRSEAALRESEERFRLAFEQQAIAAEEQLERLTLHDDLTGLPNRRLINDRLNRALDRSERDGHVVVLLCDLDGFKRINDAYGHHAGDALLVESAHRLVAASPKGATVGRMGGDEFVVICSVPPKTHSAVLAETVVGRIERSMSESIIVDGAEHRVTLSAGIRLAGPGEDADAVLSDAEEAMYLAKAQGKNGHATFEPTLQANALRRHRIERQIRNALVDNTIEVFYQPIVEPASGRVRAVEALLRIRDEDGRYLDTLQAVKVAEQSGVISAVDQRVLHLACAQIATWRRQPRYRDLGVTVNRSAAEIARPGFYDRVAAVLAGTGLDPRALTVEITETVLLDVAHNTVTDLRRLRAAGVGIAIDDFGTGYASLLYLATLPISCLKVDRSFTAGLPDDPTCSTILRATVGLAADLGMACVVEGVETIEQLAALPDSKELLVQGYLYGRPRPASDDCPTHLTPTGPSDSRS